MLKSLKCQNFTLFKEAEFEFGADLNILVGENGTGKSHVLKAAYVPLAAGVESAHFGPRDLLFVKESLVANLAQKLVRVFRPDGLGRLVRRQRGRNTCRLKYQFNDSALNLAFSFSSESRSVKIEDFPETLLDKRPVFLPTRELLSIYPGFVSLYETTQLEFPETWRDTCILLGAPLAVIADPEMG